MLMQRLNTGTTGKIFKMLLLAVLFAAVAGLILTDTNGIFRSGVGRQDVARIGKKSIGVAEFAQDYRMALQQSGIPDDAARKMGVPYQLLQQLVGREVLLQAAHKVGVRISDAYIGTELHRQLESIKQPGTAQEKLDAMLQQRGMTEKKFVDLVRGDYAINVLTNAPVSSDLNAPSALVTALYASDKEKRIAQTVTITASDLKGQQPLSDAAIKAFYDENKDRYKTEEKRDIAILVLPKNLFNSTDPTVSDADVQAYYDENKNEFLTPERVRFEQVIADTEEAADKIVAAKASLSSAKGDKNQYVAEDWYTKTTLPPELQKAIYTDKPKGTLGPIQTSLGWHVLNIKTYEDAKAKSFADVKDIIARQMKDEKLDAQIAEFSDHLDGLITSGQDLDAIGAEYKQTAQHYSDLTVANAADKIKSANLSDEIATRIRESSFALDEDEMSPLMDLPNGDFALLQVTKVNEATVPALDKIKATVTADARNANEAKSLIAYAEKVIGDYDTRKPETFLKAVEKNGLSAQTTAAYTRADAETNLGKDKAGLLFSLTPGNRLSFANQPDKVILLFLKDVVPSSDRPSDKELTELKKKMGETLSDEVHQQFMQAWQNDIGVTINSDLIKKQFIDVQQQ